MSARQLVDVLVMVVVVVMGAERVRETHQPAQGASELGVRMLEYTAVHARPGCGGAEVKMQREAVWLNMQSKQKVGQRRKKRRRGTGGGDTKAEVGRGGEKGSQADSRLPRPRCGL